MSSDLNGPPDNAAARTGLGAMILIGLPTIIGLWLAMSVTDDVGTALTWFWIGVALAGVYLLVSIANSIATLGSNY